MFLAKISWSTDMGSYERDRHHQDKDYIPDHPDIHQYLIRAIFPAPTHTHITMPPKTQRVVVERAGGRRVGAAQKGYFGQAYDAVTSSENASVVRSIAVFGVRETPGSVG